MNRVHVSHEDALLALVQSADDLTTLYRAGLLPARHVYSVPRNRESASLRGEVCQLAFMDDLVAYTDSLPEWYK